MDLMSPNMPQHNDAGLSEDLECMPFKERLKLLRSRIGIPDCADGTTCFNTKWRTNSLTGFSDYKEDEHLKHKRLAIESPASCTSDGEDHMSPGQSSTVAAVSQTCIGSAACCDEDTSPDSCICSTRLPSALSGYDFVPQKQLNVADGTSKSSMSSNASVKVEMNSRDDRSMTSSRDSSRGVDCCYEEGPEVKYEMSHNDDDNLDTMVLRKRRRMLLSRISKQSPQPLLVGYTGLSNLSADSAWQRSIVIETHDSPSVQEESFIDNQLDSSGNTDIICLTMVTSNGEIRRESLTLNHRLPSLSDEYQAGVSVESRSSTTLTQCHSDGCQEGMTSIAETKVGLSLSSPVSVKVEPLSVIGPEVQEKSLWDGFHIQNVFRVKADLRFLGEAPAHESNDLHLPGGTGLLPSRSLPKEVTTLSYPVEVKVEPLDIIDLQVQPKCAWDEFHFQNIFPVKSEPSFLYEAAVDELDHLPLIKRMRLLPSATSSFPSTSCNFKSLDLAPEVMEPVKPNKIDRTSKRKRTATDSAETALVEDAPELLKFLLERGVPVEEMKLYGGIGSDEPIDQSFCEDWFVDLEAVMSQLFSVREPFIKFPLLRASKASKANYCLACLLSLVSQAQYLRTLSWPVEWGWCRDLLSFVFVFPRHNRIVLERPEYGYATYFFELLDYLPVTWQIRRLVTTMKLTNCGRITLVENKPLVVGEDLSEGEARVLAEYGWIPNTGLGTMLNYCDRVVHDRKKEVDPREWRSKIGKLLMDGYSGGTLVCSDVPKKLLDHQYFQNRQVKLEQP
ncbi:hypothetical protein Droror1_Dr00020374 [Drosera rotundifolia]